MKTVITVVADLVRSLVMSALAAGSLLLLIVAGLAVAAGCVWRLWRRTHR